MNILEIIQQHSLTVRCLPYKTVSVWGYRDGDEKKLGGFDGRPIHLEGGKTLNATREVITNFGNSPPEKKFIKETRIVENGGWWYVKETKHTSSTVTFNRKYDKFFAPTLEEAMQMYLDSIK